MALWVEEKAWVFVRKRTLWRVRQNMYDNGTLIELFEENGRKYSNYGLN